MLGKQKCRILKEIRQKIADENDIPYVTAECRHQGECKGTCPKCESELRYLEQQLAARAALGKKVAVAALCTGLTLTASACTAEDIADSIYQKTGLDITSVFGTKQSGEPEIYVTEGEVAWPEYPEEGEIECPEPEPEPIPPELELMGDFPYIEPEKNG